MNVNICFFFSSQKKIARRNKKKRRKETKEKNVFLVYRTKTKSLEM